MSFDTTHAIDSIKEGTKEVAETAQVKTSEFHEKYVSKVVPDCGKYGDAAKFVAEMAPGVAEYNAIREGDWTGFAISAGIDVAALAAGALTVGTGYGAVKGGSIGAKAGAKAAKSATRELAEAGAKKAAKEIAKEGAEKAIKESAEAGAKKIVQEAAETGAEKAAKELAEAGAEKAVKEMAEEGAEKAAKELAEAGAEKAAKEMAEAGSEKVAKELAEESAEKAAKEVAEEGAEKITKEAAEESGERITRETAEKVTAKSMKEVGEKIDKSLIPDYFEEVKEITNREIKPNQLEQLQKALEEKDFAKLDPENLKLHKMEYARLRDKLIDEWEKNVGEKWPVYAEDVTNEAGIVLRQAGHKYDVHHIIPQNFGGPNEWWNFHPAAHPSEHQNGIHAANSLASKIFGR